MARSHVTTEKAALSSSKGTSDATGLSLPDLSATKLDSVPTLETKDHLGAGGFGVVYKATLGEKIVAFKQIRTSKVKNTDKALSALKQEAGIMAALGTHPNIVRLIGTVGGDENFMLVMEYVDGEDLAQFGLHKIYYITLQQRMTIALDIAKGLQYLHGRQQPIIHQDIKPQNILLDTDRNAKICDFGLATPQTADAKDVGLIGTLTYVAPEAMRRHKPNTSIDIWAFGLIFWGLLYNKLKLSIDDLMSEIFSPKMDEIAKCDYKEKLEMKKIMQKKFRDSIAAHQLRLIVPSRSNPGLIDLLKRCLAFEPGQRPKASDIVTALTTFIQETLPAPVTPFTDESPVIYKHEAPQQPPRWWYLQDVSHDTERYAPPQSTTGAGAAGAGAGAGAGTAPPTASHSLSMPDSPPPAASSSGSTLGSSGTASATPPPVPPTSP